MNKEILEEWIDSIRIFPRLELNEAKSLYCELCRETDIDKKKALRNRLIEGLLYLVAERICKDEFAFIESSSYDMNDLINAGNEYLIKFIDNGRLLKMSSFIHFFNREFYIYLANSLLKDDSNIYSNFRKKDYTFAFVFEEFLRLEELNGEVTFSQFKEIVERLVCQEESYDINTLYRVCCNSSKLLFEADKRFNKTEIQRIRDFLINSSYEIDQDIDSIVLKDNTSFVVDKNFYNLLITLIEQKTSISDRTRDMLYRAFGIGSYTESSFSEVGRHYNLSNSRVTELARQAFSKMRNDSNVQKLIKEII